MIELNKIHNLIDQKEYKVAIELIQDCLIIEPSNNYILKLLDYCKKQIKINEKIYFTPLGKGELSGEFKSLLNLFQSYDLDLFFDGKLDSSLFNYKDFGILENLDNLSHDFSSLKAFYQLVRISPLQYPLLYYIASFLKYFEIDKYENELQNESEKINLLILIRSIYEPFEFTKVKKYLLKKGIKWKNLIGHPLINFSNDSMVDVENKIKTLIIKYGKVETIDSAKKIKISAGSIFLNESKFMIKNVFNHYNFIDEWYLVEGACQGYPPDRVTKDGFSTDLSALYLSLFPDPQNKLKYISHGWTSNKGEMAKCELRNEYLRRIKGEILVVIDIDEFYTSNSFQSGLKKIQEGFESVVLPQIHFWKSTKQFITGKYYDVSHTRFFRNHPGLIYKQNHNFPENVKGDLLNINKEKNFKFPRTIKNIKNEIDYFWEEPFVIHMGFAKSYNDMQDKTQYYKNRGEEITRKDTTDSRGAWFTEEIPDKCKIRSYNGDLPLVLK